MGKYISKPFEIDFLWGNNDIKNTRTWKCFYREIAKSRTSHLEHKHKQKFIWIEVFNWNFGTF